MPELNFGAMSYRRPGVIQLNGQRLLNAFVEPTPRGSTSELPVIGNPGLTLFSRLGNGPVGQMHVMADNLYVLSGNQLFEIKKTDVLATPPGYPVPNTLIGTTNLGGGAISMADNAKQLVMVDGSAGWIYQPGGLNQVTTANAAAGATTVQANITGTIHSGDTIYITADNGSVLTATASATVNAFDDAISFTPALTAPLTAGAIITDPLNVLAQILNSAFQPASTVRYLDGYFVFNVTNGRQFFLSAINDGTQYSGLDFATATAGSESTVAVEVYHEQLLIFCGKHTEVWWNSGALAFPFQRYDAALIARGLAAPLATCSEDNTVVWMGEDGIAYRLKGFEPERISTFATEGAWARYPQKFLDCQSFVLDQEGHKFVIFNFISGQATWCYDIAGGKVANFPAWSERESYGTPWV